MITVIHTGHVKFTLPVLMISWLVGTFVILITTPEKYRLEKIFSWEKYVLFVLLKVYL